MRILKVVVKMRNNIPQSLNPAVATIQELKAVSGNKLSNNSIKNFTKYILANVGVVIAFICLTIAFIFWLNPFEWDLKEYKANIIVELISIAITVGIIDVIVNIIPKKNKKNTAKILIADDVSSMMSNMEFIISITLQIFKINKNLENIVLEDIKILGTFQKRMQHNNEAVFWREDVYSAVTKERMTGFLVNKWTGTLNDNIKSRITNVLTWADQVKKYEYFYYDDIEFVESITRIQNNKFLQYYSKTPTQNNDCFLFEHSDRDFFDLIILHKTLRKLTYNSYFSNYTLIKEGEQ